MDGKTSDWRPGPSVCRCCLAEGCYKDISTEYFWMGKREVYADMLSDTFSVSIAYSSAGGPNSHSRLICEPCISRLRDAADFKRQVQECERTFMQHLDPGSTSAANDIDIEAQPAGKEVKLEQVKLEKRFSDDDFDTADFGDEDDDDMDDQPLTKFATKVPKKEAVDFLDLIDNSQITVKRMSMSKSKAPPAKKVKVTKKEPAKPTASKAPIKVVKEKKKKGKKEEAKIKSKMDIARPDFPYYLVTTQREGEEKRAAFRNNITTILESCTAYPFKYRKGAYMCFFCKSNFLEPEELRHHTMSQHSDLKQMKPRKYEPIKMDFGFTRCKICDVEINDYSSLKVHLTVEHGKEIDSSHGESVLPYKLNKNEHRCQICGKRYEMFLSLHKHMNEHYDHFICETCGKRFATSQRMVNHARTHETGNFPCKRCGLNFQTYSSRYAHIAKVHRSNNRYKCPICDEKFSSYKHRLKHLSTIHGEQTAVFPCPSCPRVFDLCSRRTAHIRFQHLQERKHVCAVCGMKFFTNYELQEHCIKHGGERIYQCDVCKKAYARLKTLREHMRIHNNDRRFVCPECKQSFIQNCSLKQHIRVHHPGLLKQLEELKSRT
ncbi:zinc finger protein 28 homolog isoform X5 [Manduca sexta]|uniref:zinc finger protein 28 homolog isoform X5 n=1 Tax=Manduca sexta TaxID=7130 RepID=UPI00188DEFD4|nr:zinc finger protein 28 homolog isoform X5 [Manduca sexta]